jgi:phage baseplate assembly protein gpV
VSSIIGTIQEIVRHELRHVRISELGVVEAAFPHTAAGDDDNYACDVRLKNSGLLLHRVPLATGHIGSAAVPNAGDLVLLTFDRGDVNQPIVVGRLYNDTDRPPLNNPNESVFRLPLAEDDAKTVKTVVRNIPTNSPPREILVEMPPKITLRITDGTVQATAGKTEMRLDQPDGGSGTVTVVAGRTVITMNQDGDVTVESAASMSLKATGDLTLEGRNVSVKSTLKTDISAGTQATLTAKLGATVDGGLAGTVKGATVQVKGITSFSPA